MYCFTGRCLGAFSIGRLPSTVLELLLMNHILRQMGYLRIGIFDIPVLVQTVGRHQAQADAEESNHLDRVS